MMLNIPPVQQSGWMWLLLTACVVGCDQYSKAWVVKHIAQGTVIPVLNGLNWVHVHNTGIAFSFFSEAPHAFLILLMGLSCIVSVGLFLALRCVSYRYIQLCCVLALLLGGALGNIMDRWTLGYVIDFIDVYWRVWHFPQFNLADAAISLGVIIFLLTPSSKLLPQSQHV